MSQAETTRLARVEEVQDCTLAEPLGANAGNHAYGAFDALQNVQGLLDRLQKRVTHTGPVRRELEIQQCKSKGRQKPKRMHSYPCLHSCIGCLNAKLSASSGEDIAYREDEER